MQYLRKIPGREDKILEGINFETAKLLVESIGGTLTVIEEIDFKKENLSDNIITNIRDTYFPELSDIKISFKTFTKKYTIGLANYKHRTIQVSTKYRNNEQILSQILYHEFLHFKYPGEGHHGENFRREEFNNPFRKKLTNILTAIS